MPDLEGPAWLSTTILSSSRSFAGCRTIGIVDSRLLIDGEEFGGDAEGCNKVENLIVTVFLSSCVCSAVTISWAGFGVFLLDLVDLGLDFAKGRFTNGSQLLRFVCRIANGSIPNNSCNPIDGVI